MLEFQNLVVYQKAKLFNGLCAELIKSHKLDKSYNDQLSRASLSIPLNIAEGSGKTSKPDRKRFYVIARASLYESTAIVDILRDSNVIYKSEYDQIANVANEISKMLFVMIRNLERVWVFACELGLKKTLLLKAIPNTIPLPKTKDYSYFLIVGWGSSVRIKY